MVRRGTAPMFKAEAGSSGRRRRVASARSCSSMRSMSARPSTSETPARRAGVRVAFRRPRRVHVPGGGRSSRRLNLDRHATQTPRLEEKRNIYCCHARVETSPAVDYFCEGLHERVWTYRCRSVSSRLGRRGPRAPIVRSLRADLLPRALPHANRPDCGQSPSRWRRTVSSSWELRGLRMLRGEVLRGARRAVRHPRSVAAPGPNPLDRGFLFIRA